MTNELLRDALRVLNRHAVAPPTTTDIPALREALEPLLFDEQMCRDDVAEICQRLDEILPKGAPSSEGQPV